MMWRNGRFLPYNGGAALFWPATGAGVSRTFPGPPGKRLILPGKLAVRGLPGAKRRDAEAAGRSALDSELSRRHDAGAWRTDWPLW